jgi:hypothetical protein
MKVSFYRCKTTTHKDMYDNISSVSATVSEINCAGEDQKQFTRPIVGLKSEMNGLAEQNIT